MPLDLHGRGRTGRLLRMKLPRIFVCALLALAPACAASSKQLVPMPRQDLELSRPDYTRIYFVREDDGFTIQHKEVRVFESDKEIGTLNINTFLCWERPGGRTLARAWYTAIDPGRGNLEGLADLDCAAGHVYWFNVTVGHEDGKPAITALDPKEGKRLVEKRSPAGTD
jgi:hypothetical protein